MSKENFLTAHLYKYEWYKGLSTDLKFCVRTTIKDAIDYGFAEGRRSDTKEDSQNVTQQTQPAICSCLEAVCKYRSATDPSICLDVTDICESKQQAGA